MRNTETDTIKVMWRKALPVCRSAGRESHAGRAPAGPGGLGLTQLENMGMIGILRGVAKARGGDGRGRRVAPAAA